MEGFAFILLFVVLVAVFAAYYYARMRLHEEVDARIHQLIFSKSHREGEASVGRTHQVTPRSVVATDLVETAWNAIDVPDSEAALNWWAPSIIKTRSDDARMILFLLKGKIGSPVWAAGLAATDDGGLCWEVIQAKQIGGLVPEAQSLANLERRVIRALRVRDPYCIITTDENKPSWKRQ